MSERIAIEFDGVGKMYRLYRNRLESFLDITSIGRAMPWWNPNIENFWALRNVSFRLTAGSRLGIIGRNGAGKTTLLKLITGNILPTEGRINVQGEVQALLEAGAGFHPEFSGYENVEASLIQNGLSRSQIKSVIDEIAEFTELGDFLKQPFKTYSAGMQARLVFTTATTIKPDILIVDEILGAGDAYFAVKSRSRMKDLVESGASILLVSHAMDQILQFCEESIWLERGRIILRGPTLEVVKAYDEFVHNLQDRQLKAVNRRRRLGFRDAVEIGHFAETFIVALTLAGAPGARADIARVDLRCEGVAEEAVRIGDPQDSDQTHFAYVATNTGTWSEPEAEEGSHFRSLRAKPNGAGCALGEMVFRSYALDEHKQHAFRIRYRLLGGGRLTAAVSRNGQAVVIEAPLPDDSTAWNEFDLLLSLGRTEDRGNPSVAAADAVAVGEETPKHTEVRVHSQHNDQEVSDGAPAGDVNALGRHEVHIDVPVDRKDEMAGTVVDVAETTAVVNTKLAQPEPVTSTMTVRRWPGEGSLLIEDLELLDAEGNERAVYQVGSTLTLRLHYRATKTGSFPVIVGIVIYRTDGINVTQHISSKSIVNVDAGDRRSVQLQFPAFDLADGRYMISVSLHRELDPQFPNETIRYDLLAYSFEFEVVGNPPLRTSLFVLPAIWKV